MENPNIATKVVHSESKAAWNVVGIKDMRTFQWNNDPFRRKFNITLDQANALSHSCTPFLTVFSEGLEVFKTRVIDGEIVKVDFPCVNKNGEIFKIEHGYNKKFENI